MSELTCSCCGSDEDQSEERTETEATTPDGGSVAEDGSSSAALERPMPDELGELLAIAHGLDEPLETLGDWVAGLRDWARRQDIWPPSLEDLCQVDESPHVLELDGETHHFACVIDPLMVPDILDREELVVRSKSPVEGTEIEIRIEEGDVEMTPSTAVLSLGAARSLGEVDDGGFAPEEAFAQLCGYANAFPNRTTYEAWAAETPEVATMAIPLDEGIELAQALME